MEVECRGPWVQNVEVHGSNMQRSVAVEYGGHRCGMWSPWMENAEVHGYRMQKSMDGECGAMEVECEDHECRMWMAWVQNFQAVDVVCGYCGCLVQDQKLFPGL